MMSDRNMMTIANTLNTLTTTDAEKLVACLDFRTYERFYRIFEMFHVKEDVKSMIDQDPDIFTDDDTDDDVDKFATQCASRYVYQEDYDCDLPYWDNIQNLITKQKWENKEKGKSK